MGKFLIFTKRGRRFAKLIKGRLYCKLMDREMRKQKRYTGPLSDGVHIVAPAVLGWDACEVIR